MDIKKQDWKTTLVISVAIRLLVCLLCLSGSAAWAQNPQAINLDSPPVPTVSVSVSYNGAIGSNQHCYWVVATFTGGNNSPLSNPACIQNASTLSAANAVNISWAAVPGITQYRIVRANNPNFGGVCSNCYLGSQTNRVLIDDGSIVPGNFNLTSVVSRSQAEIKIDNLAFTNPRLVTNTIWSTGSLGPGTPTTLTFLRGDGWQPLSGIDPFANIQAGEVPFGTAPGVAVNTPLVTALGGLLTNGRVPYISGGVITTSPNLLFTGTNLTGFTTGNPSIRLVDFGSSIMPYGFVGDESTGMRRLGAGSLGFYSSAKLMATTGGGTFSFNVNDPAGTAGIIQGGGPQTFIVHDQAATGKTRVVFRAALAQGIINLTEWRTQPDVLLAYVDFDGNATFPKLAIMDNTTPASAAAACVIDNIWADADYIYFCVASGNIKRSAIATW